MAIKNELDLGIKYKQAIEVEVNKSQIQKPVQTVMPTQQSGFSVLPTNVSTVKQPTIKKVEPVKMPNLKQAITSPFQPFKETKTIDDVVSNLQYVQDWSKNVGQGTKLGVKNIPIVSNVQNGLLKNIAFFLTAKTVSSNIFMPKEERETLGAIADMFSPKELDIFSSKDVEKADFFVMTSDRQQEIIDRSLDILKNDSAYLTGLKQNLQKKYENKNIYQTTKIGTELADSLVDMIPNIATNTVLGAGGMAVMFSTVSARAVGDGLNQGLSSVESGAYGSVMGAMEVATELAGAGISGMESTAFGKWTRDKVRNFLPKVVSKIAKDTTSSVALNLIADGVLEGFEEVMSELGGFWLGKMYEIEQRTGKELTEDVAYSFILGSLSSVAMNIGHSQVVKVMESVANSSSIHNLTRDESRRLSEKISNQIGYKYKEITREKAIEIGKEDTNGFFATTTGFVNHNEKTIYVVDDGTVTNPLAETTMHEIAHPLEMTKEYKQLLALVKAHIGDVAFQENVEIYRNLYKAKKGELTKTSKIDIGESEFIAQKIIQEQIFGMNSGMRVSFIKQLVGENPTLMEKFSDRIDSYLKNIRNIQLDEDAMDAELAYIAYIDNLKGIFKASIEAYKTQQPTMLEQAQAEMAGVTKEAEKTQFQIAREELDNIDVNFYTITDNEYANELYFSKYAVSTQIKELRPNIKLTFELSNEDMDSIDELLFNMSDESANDNELIISAVNDVLNDKITNWRNASSDLQKYQLGQFLVYIKSVQRYYSNSKKIDSIMFVGSKKDVNITDLEFSNVINENVAYTFWKNFIDKIKDKPVSIIGLENLNDKELVVLHNLNEYDLMKTFELGGFAMPSLAVTKASYGHSDFGDITIVFNEDVLNGTPTYSSDAYTPTFPVVYDYLIVDSNKIDQLDKDTKRFDSKNNEKNRESGYYYLKNYISDLKNSNILNIDDSVRRIVNSEIGKQISSEVSQITGSNSVYENFYYFISKYNDGKKYFRNDVELFMQTGARRPISKLMNELTLSNVVSHMNRHSELVGTEFGGWNADSAKVYKSKLSNTMASVEDVKQNKDLIKKNELYEQALRSADFSINEVLNYIDINNVDFYIEGSYLNKKYKDLTFVENGKTKKAYQPNKKFPAEGKKYFLQQFIDKRLPITEENIINHFLSRGYVTILEVTTDEMSLPAKYEGMTNAQIITQALTDIRDLTVTYFEAKPRRAVEFSEIKHILLPDNASQKIIDILNEKQIPFTKYFYTYDNEDANGRRSIIRENKDWQFQLATMPKIDSNGTELTQEQQTFFYNTKVLDDDNRLLQVQKDGILGYLNIQNLFDTRDRLNQKAIDAYNYINTVQIEPNENGMLSGEDASKLLGYLHLNGYNFDGIIFDNNGVVDYMPLTFNQFKGVNENVNEVVNEIQFQQYKDVIDEVGTLYYINVSVLRSYSFDTIQSYSLRNKVEVANEIDRDIEIFEARPEGIEKKSTLAYLRKLKKFIAEYDVNDKHDASGNVISLAQEEFYKDSVIRAEGLLLPVYHATNEEFNEFSYKNAGRNGIAQGFGFYTAIDITRIFQYTENSNQIIKELYLNVKNPMYSGYQFTDEQQNSVIGKKTIAIKYIDKLIEIAKPYADKYDRSLSTLEKIKTNIQEYNKNKIDLMYTKEKCDESIYDLMSPSGDGLTNKEFENLVLEFQKAFVETTGYDGIVMEGRVIAFLPNQLKDIDNKNPQDTPYLIEQPEVQMQLSDEIAEKIKDDIYINVIDLELNDLKNSYDTYLLLESSNAQEAYNNDIYDYSSFVDDYVEEMEVDLNEAIEELWYQFREDSMYYLKNDYDEYLEKDLLKEEHSKLLVYVYNLIETLPTPNNINRSNKSISTYLTYDSSKYDEVLNALQKNSYEINTLKEDLKYTFEVRISDHYGGTYRDLMTGQLEKYQEGDISIILSKSANIQMQILDKSSTGEKLTDGQKAFFSNVAPIMLDDKGKLKTVYHGSNFIFTVPLQDKSNGNYRFGKHNVMFFSMKEQISNSYAEGKSKIIDFKSDNTSGNTYKGYIRAEKPLVIDAKGSTWNSIQMIDEKDNNNYSIESKNNFDEFFTIVEPEYINTNENIDSQIDFTKKQFLDFKESLFEYIKQNSSIENYTNKDVIKMVYNIEDVLNKSYESLNKYKETKFSGDVVFEVGNIEETRFILRSILKTIRSDKNINLDYDKESDFNSVLSEIVTSKYTRYTHQYKEFLYKLAYDEVAKYKSLSTNDIVKMIIDLKEKGLVTTDSIYIKNIFDVGEYADYKTYGNVRDEFVGDIIITLEDSMFKDYQNENPTEDADIQLQIATTNFIEDKKAIQQATYENYKLYQSRMKLNLGNMNNDVYFNDYLKEQSKKLGRSISFKEIKDFYLPQYKRQNDQVKKDYKDYQFASSILQDEKNKLRIVNTILADIPYTRITTSKGSSSVYAEVPISELENIIEKFGAKSIIGINPDRITGNTFTVRISDHDRMSESYEEADIALDIRDFGYIRPSMIENIRDSKETDSKGNKLSIGQAKRFSLSKARDESGNLIPMYFPAEIEDGAILKAGTIVTSNEELAGVYMAEKGSDEYMESIGIKPIMHQGYLDTRNIFDTRKPEHKEIYDKYAGNIGLNKNGLPKKYEAYNLKNYLIKNGYDFDSALLQDGNENIYITLKDGMGKSIDNKNPLSAPSTKYIGLNESLTIQHQLKNNLYSQAITKEEFERLDTLRFMDDKLGLSDDEALEMKNLEDKLNQVVKLGDLISLVEVDKSKKWTNEFGKIYRKIKNKQDSVETDNIAKSLLSLIKPVGNSQRRTKQQWLEFAKQYGRQYEASSQMDILERAIELWFYYTPNIKEHLNRQGAKFVEFKVNDFVKALLQGADMGMIVSSETISKTSEPDIIQDMVKESETIQEVIPETSENYEEEAPFYPYPDDYVPAENEEYYNPNLDDLNDFFTENYVKEVHTKPVIVDEIVRTRKHPRTIIASGNVSEAIAGEVENDIENGNFDYVVFTDKRAIEIANRAIEDDLMGQKITFIQNFENGLAFGKDDIAIGEALLIKFSELKDVESAKEIISVLASVGTEMGQSIQALSLIKKLSASGQLMAIEKIVKRMNNTYAKENKVVDGKVVKLEIKEELKTKLLNQIDKKDIQNVIDEIKIDLASQVPSTWWDKINAWRYMSMLGNVRTHLRNIIGNIVMVPVRLTRDALSTALQLTLSKEQRDKNIMYLFDKELRAYASADFEAVKDSIVTSGKYDTRTDIEQKKTVFKNKTLEYLMNKNFDALEYEDLIFRRSAYISSLAQFMKARGWTPETIAKKQLIQARSFAEIESKKMVFQQASALANMLNKWKMKNRSAGLLLDAVVPFTKTPINILKIEAEFSPLGLMVNTPKYLLEITRGEPTTDTINKMTAGMTGAMISALGAFLYSMGWLNVGEDDEEPDKLNTYNRSLGFQRYSLNILGGTYSIDWMAPAIVPLIMGAELQKALEDKEGDSIFNYAPDILLGVFDPLFDMSMLKGVMDATQSFAETSAGKFGEALATAGSNYVGQFIPTLLGQFARTFDEYQRSIYAPKDSSINPLVERSLRQIANKIPFVSSYVNSPLVDIHGNPVKNDENIFVRALMNFISVGTYKKDVSTSLDKEILRLYEITKDSDVIPSTAPKSFTYNGQNFVLNNEEYSEFGERLGQTTYESIQTMVNNPDYKRLTSSEKASLADDIYKYAYTVAKERYLLSQGIKLEDAWYDNVNEAKQVGIYPVEYLLLKHQYNIIESDSLNSKKDKFIDYLNSTGRGLNLDKYLKYIGGYETTTQSYNLLEGLIKPN